MNTQATIGLYEKLETRIAEAESVMEKRAWSRLSTLVFDYKDATTSLVKQAYQLASTATRDADLMSEGYSPSFHFIASEANRVVEYKAQVEKLTDEIKNTVHILGLTAEEKDVFWSDLQAFAGLGKK